MTRTDGRLAHHYRYNLVLDFFLNFLGFEILITTKISLQMCKSFYFVLLYVTVLYFNISTASAQTCVTGVQSNVVNITGVNNLVITNLRINPTNGQSCIVIKNCTNITITNCILGPSANLGIDMENCGNVTVSGNSFMNNMGAVYVANCTGGIKIDNNQFANVDGPFPRGQFVQFVNCSGAGNEIQNNVGENVLGVNSNPVDLINIFNTNGTSSSPILINGNKFRGGGPSGSGGGILAGDGGGSYITVENNMLVDPGQYGIGVPSGTNIKLLNNEVYGRQQHFTNVGMYMYKNSNYSSLPCGYDTVQNNQVNFTDSLGINSPFYIPGSPPSVACSPIVTTPNNWNASIGPSILPSRLLCPLLMANFKFNSNWADSSGSALNASPVNMAYAGQGRDLMCANFNGTSAYLTVPRSPWLIPLTERITVSCWIKTMKTTGIQGMAQSQDGDGYNNGWRMLLNGNTFNVRVTTAGGVADFNCGTVTQGVWTLLTMTYDGQQVKGYVNGVLQASEALIGNITYSGSTSMKIGNCNGTNYYFYGYMDEYKFYDGNLLDSDVLNDYNSSVSLVTTPSPEVRGLYYFDQQWLDATGYHLDATDHGASFICDGERYSANFPGNSYLTLLQSPLLNPFSSTFTVGCWIKPTTVSGMQSIAQAENSDGYNTGWRMSINNNVFDGRLVTNQGAVDLYCGCMQAGVWQNVVMTYDGTSLKLYRNGSLVESSSQGGYIVYGSSSLAQIGLCNGVGYLNGHLDIFEFWDGPLSATAVQQLYNYWLPTFQAGSNCQQILGNMDTAKDIDQSSKSSIEYSVFPNPAIHEITIQKTGFQKEHLESEMIHAELFSASGQLLRSKSGNGNLLTMNVADLKEGIYFLRLTDYGNSLTKKIIIAH